MRTHVSALVLLAPLAVLSTGCQEYFSVDEACHPEADFRGSGQVDASEAAAVNRMNCYRRLTGLERYGVSGDLQGVADGIDAYVLANPEAYGSGGAMAFLNQDTAGTAFSGATVYERIGNTDYQLYGTSGTFINEFVVVDHDNTYTPETYIDLLMSMPIGQEQVLRPSAYDVAFGVVPLDADWFAAAAEAGNWSEAPATGTAYYSLVVSEGIPYEHSGSPLVFPKADQTDAPTSHIVPAYKVLSDGTLEEYTFSAPIYIAYVSPNSSAAATGTSVVAAGENPFGQTVLSASIVQAGSIVLDTVIVNPEGLAESETEWIEPDLWWDTSLGSAIFATTPFEPGTEYSVYVDMTTSDGPQSYSWSFTTGAGGAVTPTGASARELAAPLPVPDRAQWAARATPLN